MKLIVFFLCFSLFSISKTTCRHKNTASTAACYKGRLEIKGACMNYTISITGDHGINMVSPAWKNESTGKIYKNVFALSSPCSFPQNINEGDEFYFMIDNTAVQDCAVCMIYYPVPEKKLSIKVLDGSCGK